MTRPKKPPPQWSKVSLRQISLGDPKRAALHSEDAIDELARSLVSKGLQEPLLVRETPKKGRMVLLTGVRRLLAIKRLGWKTVDCLVLDATMQAEAVALQGLAKGEVDPWKLADALRSLKEKMGWTQQQLGLAIGRNRDFVASTLAITQIVPPVRRLIKAHARGSEMTPRHLRHLGRLPPDEQEGAALNILENRTSTTLLEREKVSHPARRESSRFAAIRPLRRPGTPEYPTNRKGWRKYLRQLNTDLRRINQAESQSLRRSRNLMTEARLIQRTVKAEAREKRKRLLRELRQVQKKLLT